MIFARSLGVHVVFVCLPAQWPSPPLFLPTFSSCGFLLTSNGERSMVEIGGWDGNKGHLGVFLLPLVV